MIHDIEDKTTASWMKEAQKGYIRMGVLILLNKKPSHGYEIMKTLCTPFFIAEEIEVSEV